MHTKYRPTQSIGWNYAFNDAISVAGDLTAAQLLLAYWHDRYTWLASLFFLLFLVLVNFIHVKAYGEVSTFPFGWLLDVDEAHSARILALTAEGHHNRDLLLPRDCCECGREQPTRVQCVFAKAQP